MTTAATAPHIAIACGGTGGHVFPGLAVADELMRRGCAVTLLVSPKEVDQQAVRLFVRGTPTRLGADGLQALACAAIRPRLGFQRAEPVLGALMEVVTLPATALQRGSRLAFLRGCWQSWRAAGKLFRSRPPLAALAMGGFTSAPPILAAKNLRAKTFIHESNTIPGRANRWLARIVDQAYVGFPSAISQLHVREATVTGTPVRSEFQPCNPTASRAALGLDPATPVLLVMGGSQGAHGINEMILSALPILAKHASHWQWLHLTGPLDADQVRHNYAALGVKAIVHPFLADMHLALGAATVAVSRAGASSLAELAAMRLPPLLVPFPYAADNHQFHNARAFTETGAARLLEQKDATPEKVASLLTELMENETVREMIQSALAQWHAPKAAAQIVEMMLKVVGNELTEQVGGKGKPTPGPSQEGSIRVIRAAQFPSFEGLGVGSSEMAQTMERRA